MDSIKKATKGAWIIHHSRKITTDTKAPAEYSVLDEAGKAAELLMRLGETKETTLKKGQVEAIARTLSLNPRTELNHFLQLLKDRRLIDSSTNEVQVLGVTTRSVLSHAADIFDEANPASHEHAAIELGEISSSAPILLTTAKEYISDHYKMISTDAQEFLRRATEIGFVDQEGESPSDLLLFNGNLFKKGSAKKTAQVLSSLSSQEQTKLNEITDELNKQGCIYEKNCEKILGFSLFEKLIAAGVLEVNTVSNEEGEHAFVTLPSAFNKFVDPLIDDTFDMAKALVSALTYGMQLRDSSQGRILSFNWILNALIDGRTIGPATAIGSDYRILEQNRVIQITPTRNNMFKMKLLKKEIGELALHVLNSGDASLEAIETPPSAPMTGFQGPERARQKTRKRQSEPSKRHTHDILSALRSGRSI